jgi:hypothetical protein
MFIFWTNNDDVKRKLFGQKIKRHCPKCNRDVTFYDCERNQSIKVMGLFALWDKNEQVMQCGECLSLLKNDEVINKGHQRSSPVEDEKRRADDTQRKAAEERQAAEEEKRKEEERARREKEELQRAAEERKAREAAVDAELADLKKKMGK